MTLQAFKANDTIEPKVRDAALPTLEDLGAERDTFYEEAYEAFPLGDVLYDLARDPLAGVLARGTFRTSFFAIHELFTRPGTFEFYLEVFRAIWGEDADVTFSVPAPGKLLITIGEITLGDFELLARRIEGAVYVYDTLTDQAGETLIVRDFLGVKTEAEVDALVHEISPAGVWVQASLAL